MQEYIHLSALKLEVLEGIGVSLHIFTLPVVVPYPWYGNILCLICIKTTNLKITLCSRNTGLCSQVLYQLTSACWLHWLSCQMKIWLTSGDSTCIHFNVLAMENFVPPWVFVWIKTLWLPVFVFLEGLLRAVEPATLLPPFPFAKNCNFLFNSSS